MSDEAKLLTAIMGSIIVFIIMAAIFTAWLYSDEKNPPDAGPNLGE